MEKLRGMNLPMPRFLQEDIPEGVKGIYGPGTPIPVSARDVLDQISKSLQV
jgi:methylmalonyl-CoA mutase cobalamin-binding subunit